MDEILTTARDLELEVNENDIEELIMEHEDELTIEELQEILNEEHRETERNVSPSEQEEDERGPMPTSAIKDLLKKWEAVRAMVLEWHPNQADVSRHGTEGEGNILQSPALVIQPTRARTPCVLGGYLVASDIEPRPYGLQSNALTPRLPTALQT
ncbi:uncharacterized protein TNCV_4560311 [Trichonephila clavipes]|nr:uncharacterized protein TNCV_4560311 [Trichonephila clavipes]